MKQHIGIISIILLSSLILCTGYAASTSQIIGAYPQLVGGINHAQLAQCTTLLNSRCARRYKARPYPTYKNACLYKYFDRQQCQQSEALYRAIGLMPKTSVRYGAIDVVTVGRYADGVSDTYIIDRRGQVVRLLSDIDITALPNSQALLKQHPKAIASNVSVEKPTYILLPDGSQRLVFLQQVLLDGTMASHSAQWQVQVGYVFSAQGLYTGAHVIGLRQS